MALILSIDTATEICSVALARGERLLAARTDVLGMNHSTMLAVFVEEVLAEVGVMAIELDAVAVSRGPGSYTGLRIGVSLAKGICYAVSRPLIAVDTLQAMAFSVADEINEEALYCPMIDARRMEVYTALYNRAGEPVEGVRAEVIDENAFSNQLENNIIYFLGNGSDKVKGVITHPNARFVPEVMALATQLVPLAERKYLAQEFEDVAYYEPLYLKEFVATTPKNKVL